MRATSEGYVVSATDDHVRLIGRTYEQDGVTWLAQSGSAVEFEVTGTRVQIQILGDENVHNEEDLLPRFAVLIDGEVAVDDTLGEESRIVEVLSGDAPTTAVVTVMLLSESVRGAVGVGDITVDTNQAGPVRPTAAADLSIEFIGDSITCGYAVETLSVSDPFTTTTENFMKTYAYLAAQELGADYSVVGYSGHGIVSGWTGDGTRNDGMLLPPLYELVSRDSNQPWDFGAHSYDVVVVNLGTNDLTYAGEDEGRLQEFSRAYADFLSQVRACNPDSYIICTLGTMDTQELYPWLEQAVESYQASSGDTRITCYLSEPIDVEHDGVGTNGHPNATSQQKAADALVDVIRQLQAEGAIVSGS